MLVCFTIKSKISGEFFKLNFDKFELNFDKFEIMLSENMIFPGCSTIRRIYFPFVEISFFAVDNDIKSV